MTGPVERPAELGDLQGAWRRSGRTLSGSPWGEVAEVLWLQVGRHFCDLRTPGPGAVAHAPAQLLDQPQAFSGTVHVRAGAISFRHDLDSLPRDPAHPDESTVHRLEDVMYERGPGFEERWVLASQPGEAVGLVELRPAGEAPSLARLVRVGPLMLATWGGRHPGGAQFNARHDWTRERPLGRCDDAWELDEAAVALGTEGALPADWSAVEPWEV